MSRGFWCMGCHGTSLKCSMVILILWEAAVDYSCKTKHGVLCPFTDHSHFDLRLWKLYKDFGSLCGGNTGKTGTAHHRMKWWPVDFVQEVAPIWTTSHGTLGRWHPREREMSKVKAGKLFKGDGYLSHVCLISLIMFLALVSPFHLKHAFLTSTKPWRMRTNMTQP